MNWRIRGGSGADWKVRPRSGLAVVLGVRCIHGAAGAQNTPGCSQDFGRSTKCGTQTVGLCRAAMGAERLALEASAKGLCE